LTAPRYASSRGRGGCRSGRPARSTWATCSIASAYARGLKVQLQCRVTVCPTTATELAELKWRDAKHPSSLRIIVRGRSGGNKARRGRGAPAPPRPQLMLQADCGPKRERERTRFDWQIGDPERDIARTVNKYCALPSPGPFLRAQTTDGRTTHARISFPRRVRSPLGRRGKMACG
jgi:hypothetical protein